MDLRERIKQLCKQNGISVNKMESELGFSTGYISKLDKSTPNSLKLQQISDYFGVTLDYLMCGNTEPSNTTSLNAKDRRNIAKDLNEIMDKLDADEAGPLNYDGVVLDENTKMLLRSAIASSLEKVKIINKERFTPKKYKK